MKVVTVDGRDLKLKISPTFLNNATCPLNLYYNYVERIPDQFQRIPAMRGSAAHEAIAQLTKYCIDNQRLVSDLTDEQLEEALKSNLSPYIAGEAGEIMKWLHLWRDRYRISQHIYGYEEKIALDEDFEEVEWSEASYRGIVDVISVDRYHCTIEDYKSQPHIFSQGDLDENEQLTFYAWLTSKLYDQIENFTCKIWYLRYGFSASTRRTKEQLEDFERALMIRIEKIAEIDSWDPIPGIACQYCTAIHKCPVALDTSDDNIQCVSQAQAARVADRVLVLETLLGTLKKNLKDYVKKNDGIRLEGKYCYDFRPSTSVTYDPAEVEEVLNRHHYELPDVCSISSDKMKKFLKAVGKDNPALEAEINDIAKEKTTTRFSGFKL